MNHIDAVDDSELDNVCPDCGEFLDMNGECTSCRDSEREDAAMERYYKEKD